MAETIESIRSLLRSEKYSDLTIRCQGTPFKLHCAIVCTRSPTLAKKVDKISKEATIREIDLPEDELPVIRAMVDYLYTGDYDNPLSNGEVLDINSDEGHLLFHVKMYVIGGKYDIPALKELAKQKFEIIATSEWNNSSFSQAASFLWTNTVDSDISLREIMVQTATAHIAELLARPEFAELMEQHGKFCLAVLRSQLGLVWWVAPPTPEPEAPMSPISGEGDLNGVSSPLPKKKKKKGHKAKQVAAEVESSSLPELEDGFVDN